MNEQFSAARAGFVVFGNPLDAKQTRMLVALYQPLVGALAISVYQTLAAFVAPNMQLSARILNKDLWSLTGLNWHQIEACCQKLEAVALLRRYQEDASVGPMTTYEVVGPQSPAGFFSDEPLCALLMATLGEGAYKALRTEWLPPRPKLNNATEVTTDFLAVFGNQLSAADLDKPAQAPAPTTFIPQTKQIMESDWPKDFDRVEFNRLVKNSFVQAEPLYKLRPQLKAYVKMYGLTETELMDAIERAADAEGVVTASRLQVAVYRLNHDHLSLHVPPASQGGQQEASQAQPPQEPAQVTSKGGPVQDTRMQKILAACEDWEAVAFLRALKTEKNGVSAMNSNAEEKWLATIFERYSVPTSVVNFAIYYAIVVKDHSTLPGAYVDSLVSNWVSQGVKTAAEAYAASQKFNAQQKQKMEQGTKMSKQRRSYTPRYGQKSREQLLAEAKAQKESMRAESKNVKADPKKAQEQIARLKARVKRLREKKN